MSSLVPILVTPAMLVILSMGWVLLFPLAGTTGSTGFLLVGFADMSADYVSMVVQVAKTGSFPDFLDSL